MTQRKNPLIDSRTLLKSHCPKGHPYSVANTGIRKSGVRAGFRYCRQCAKVANAIAEKRRRRDDPERVSRLNKIRGDRWRSNPDVKRKLWAKSREWYRANREWALLRNVLRRYNLTLDQYHSMCERSNFACLICGSDGRLVVDHCHKTNRNRGMLCIPCNAGIGQIGEDPMRLRAAADYLESHVDGSVLRIQ